MLVVLMLVGLFRSIFPNHHTVSSTPPTPSSHPETSPLHPSIPLARLRSVSVHSEGS